MVSKIAFSKNFQTLISIIFLQRPSQMYFQWYMNKVLTGDLQQYHVDINGESPLSRDFSYTTIIKIQRRNSQLSLHSNKGRHLAVLSSASSLFPLSLTNNQSCLSEVKPVTLLNQNLWTNYKSKRQQTDTRIFVTEDF